MLAKFALAALAVSGASAQLLPNLGLGTQIGLPTPIPQGPINLLSPDQVLLTQPSNVFTTLAYNAIINGVPAVVSFTSQAPPGTVRPPPVAGQPCTTPNQQGVPQAGTYVNTAGLTTCQPTPVPTFTAGAACTIAATATTAAAQGTYTATGQCGIAGRACTIPGLGLGQGTAGTFQAGANNILSCVAGGAVQPPATGAVGSACQIGTVVGTVNAAGACQPNVVAGQACTVPAAGTVPAKPGKYSAALVCVANPAAGDICTTTAGLTGTLNAALTCVKTPAIGDACNVPGAAQTGTGRLVAPAQLGAALVCQAPTAPVVGAACTDATTGRAGTYTRPAGAAATAPLVCTPTPRAGDACTVPAAGTVAAKPGTLVAGTGGALTCQATVVVTNTIGSPCQTTAGTPGTFQKNTAGATVCTALAAGAACKTTATPPVDGKVTLVAGKLTCVATPAVVKRPGDACTTTGGAAGRLILNAAGAQTCVTTAVASSTVGAPCTFTGGAAGVVTKIGTAAAKCTAFTATATSCATLAKLSALQLTACTTAKFTPK